MERLRVDVEAGGRIEACEVEVDDETSTIVFTGAGRVRETFRGDDLFEALKALRAALAPARVLCAGARLDVWPSAMARAGGGRKAYVTRMGAQTCLSDLVDIFAPAPADTIATLDDQAAFHARWAASTATSEVVQVVSDP